jgi:hypothetical protein
VYFPQINRRILTLLIVIKPDDIEMDQFSDSDSEDEVEGTGQVGANSDHDAGGANGLNEEGDPNVDLMDEVGDENQETREVDQMDETGGDRGIEIHV